ncbi:hypothetical protein EMCRGX_G028338 [Ephydatia muelleri]
MLIHSFYGNIRVTKTVYALTVKAAANINTTLLSYCVNQSVVTGTNCSALTTCTNAVQASLGTLGCCYSDTYYLQIFGTFATAFKSCGVTPPVAGKCNAPFSAAAANTTATILLVYVALLLAAMLWV